MPRLVETLSFCALLFGACVIVDELPPLERNDVFYGPCEDEFGRVICREEAAACDYYPDFEFPEMSVCTVECNVDEDCVAPETGDPIVKCNGSPAACVLECADGEACPDGMVCAPTKMCMWRN